MAQFFCGVNKHCGEMLAELSAVTENSTQATVPKGEIEYYKSSDIRVTSSLIKIGTQTYQASNISSVLIKQRQRTFSGCMGTGALITLGYVVFMVFCAINTDGRDSPMANIAMAGPLLWMIALIYAAFRRQPYELRLTTSGLEKCALVSPQRSSLEPIAEAVEKAFRGN